MLEMGKRGVVVGALVGAETRRKTNEAGVDVLIVSGTEAGGHCGEVSTMVLVPEVCQAVADSNVPVLAAEELRVDKWQLQWPWAPRHGLLYGWQHQS